jgi:hypothetical protein
MQKVLLAILLLFPACRSFEPLPIDEEEEAVVVEEIGHVLPAREEIRYVGTWNGIPAGRATLRFETGDGEVRAEATARTSGLFSLVYGVGVRARGVSGAADGKSRIWSYETDGGDPEKRIVARFDPKTGDIVAFLRKGDEREERRMTAPAALDPFAALLSLRRSDLLPGESFRVDVFTEWYVYRVDVQVGEVERVRVPAGDLDAVKVRVDIRKVKNGVAEEKSNGAAVFLTPDDDRVPVLIEADTNLGRIALKMTDYGKGWPRVTSGRGTPAE